jgi:hypothetical protein
VRKLTLIVSCTGRKFLAAAPELQARNLPAGSVSERADVWGSRIASASVRCPLDQLYQGGTWVQTAALLRAAERRGFDTRLLVASAGLGLREVSSLAPGYSATFSMAKLDSVVVNRPDARAWWRSIVAQPGALDPGQALRGRVLLVLSEPYASALESDLRVLAQRAEDALLVGGAQDIPGLPRVPADKALRRVLGGTATSLILRMARAWLDRAGGARLHTALAEESWEAWARDVREPDLYGRQARTDEQVVAFVKQLRARDASVSKTKALRLLRDHGLACEQHRFAALFDLAVGAR